MNSNSGMPQRRKISKKVLIVIILSIITIIVVVLGLCLATKHSGKPIESISNEMKPQDTIPQQDTTPPEIIYPFITAEGVGPFVLGTIINDIPYKSTWYDTIIWKRYYVEDLGEGGDNYIEEEKFSKDALFCKDAPILSIVCRGTVCLERKTLLEVKTDENLNIKSIAIKSDKLAFENGIHIGSPADTIYAKGGALYATEGEGGFFGGFLYYKMPGIETNGFLRAEEYSMINDKSFIDFIANNYSGGKIPLKYAKATSVREINIY